MRRANASSRPLAIAVLCACACDPAEDEHRPFDDLGVIPADVPEPREGPVAGVITPVVFVPTDRAVDQARIDAVSTALLDVQSWYREQLGSYRLEMGPVQIVYGSLTAQEYRGEDQKIWNRGPDEIEAQLGYSPWDEGHIVLLVGAGLGDWALGGGTGTAGYATMGLDSLTDPQDCIPGSTSMPGDPQGELWWCTPEMWRGTAIHELGHALSLPHSAAPSIMFDHKDYPNKVLLDDDWWAEKWKVRYGNFVRPLQGGGDDGGDPSAGDGGGDGPQPGDDWQPCNADEECHAGWCGCGGGTDRVCLPSSDYSKDCAGWKGEGEACGGDGECVSLWCGCNGGAQMVCLASFDVPKDCVVPGADWSPCSSDGECNSQWCGCNGGTDTVCLPNQDYAKECT